MLFAHLAPSHAIDRIKRNGLRQGDGRCGRGVYCVPLFDIPKRTQMGDPYEEGAASRVLVSTPSTSVTLWKGLYRFTQRKKDRPIAVVFRAPSGAWPADLYIQIEAREAKERTSD